MDAEFLAVERRRPRRPVYQPIVANSERNVSGTGTSYKNDDETLTTTTMGDESEPSPAQIETMPVYMVTYGTGATAIQTIANPQQLRDELEVNSHRRQEQKQEREEEEEEEKEEGDAQEHKDQGRLVVIHGLPADYVDVVRDELGLEAAFIDALVTRRFYGPRRTGFRGACFEYPELVKRVGPRALLGSETSSSSDDSIIDILSDPPVYAISHGGDQVVFCRASLWIGEEVHVLFLDHPTWRKRHSVFHKARHSLSVTKPCDCPDKKHSWDLGLVRGGKEIESMEWRLVELLGADSGSGAELLRCLSQTVYGNWIEILEAMYVYRFHTLDDCSGLCWQMEMSLERNLDTARHIEEADKSGITGQDWQSLLEKTGRRARFFIQRPVNTEREKGPDRRRDLLNLQNILESSDRQQKSEMPDSAENQRSLDRVSYLGGILLPFSIVSSILSMGDPFAPGGSQFFVFWAIAIPLALISMFIIYADSIRKAEVWIEVAAEQAHQGRAAASEAPSTPRLEEGLAQPVDGLGITTTGFASLPEKETGNNNKPHEDHQIPQYSYQGSVPPNLPQGVSSAMWKKRQLGWMGACKTIFQLSKLEEMRAEPSGLNRRRLMTK